MKVMRKIVLCVLLLSLFASCEKKESLEDTAIKVDAEGAIQLDVQKSDTEKARGSIRQSFDGK